MVGSPPGRILSRHVAMCAFWRLPARIAPAVRPAHRALPRRLAGRAFPDVLPAGPDGERGAVGLLRFLQAAPGPCLCRLEENREVRVDTYCDDALCQFQGVVANGDLLLEPSAKRSLQVK